MNKYQEALDSIKGSLYCCGFKLLTYIATLQELVDKEDKYKWHDLRENPNDLPEENKRIIFYTIPFYHQDGTVNEEELRYWSGIYDLGWFYNDDYEGYVTRGGYVKSEVIAWKYIEEFEND